MSRRILAALALGLGLSAGQAAAQGLTPLSLGEHLALRSYTGQAIGQTLIEVLRLPSVGILANTSSICAALSGAAASQILETRRGADFALAAVATPEEAAAAAREMTRLSGIALLFGGQTPPAENAALVRAVLGALAERNYQGPVFLHLATWAGQWLETAAQADPAIAAWAAAHPQLFALTVDAERARAIIRRVTVAEGLQRAVAVAHEVPMDEPWITLFRRSLLRRS
jgi:hypothetical protein